MLGNSGLKNILLDFYIFPHIFWGIRAKEGGVSIFSLSLICYSPDYHISKMGLLSSQPLLRNNASKIFELLAK